MTTPQATLQNLSHDTQRMLGILEGNEHTGNITEILTELELQNDDIIAGQMRLENLMNLIVKFLGREDTAQCCVNSNVKQSCVKVDSAQMCAGINASTKENI